ncbi:sigma-E factor negative regulatory protein [Leptothrix discophora]|uniref:Sigma-E factor negative regulatory protein n=1 Tax=Leptothrix discophora TaxID=89 RepID=A0ABT9G074_LEPDI|nr:sigma-E factor negative regulatory protein [Leptothrix discophora]MDP4299820.1 sigma-E factor negative regulatory protein [Leptothrix discophora]
MSETTDPNLPDNAPDAERLSALLDGELERDEVAPLSAAWGRDVHLREQWQAYGLIGDVLRTGEPTRSPSRDQQLFDTIRARLAEEPVVLAPLSRERSDGPVPGAEVIALPARNSQRTVARSAWRRHAIPAAGIAAGLAFVSVMVLKLPQPAEGGVELSTAQDVGPGMGNGPALVSTAPSLAQTPDRQAASPSTPSGEPAVPMQSYLQAHRAMTAGFAIDPGPGQLRRVAQEQGAR